MDYPWIIHGSSTGNPWMFHGETMDHTWMIHGLSMDNPWNIHGWSMDHPWMIHGRPMDYPWTIHGLSMDNPWIIHGYIHGYIPKTVLTNIPAMGQKASKICQNNQKSTNSFCSFQTHMDRHGVFSTALCREFRRGSFYNPPKPVFWSKNVFF